MTFFSTTTRSGRWPVPAVLTIAGGFSETTLDLREADFSTEVVEIRLTDVFSSAEIIVPRGVGVDLAEGTAIFSEVKGDYTGVSDPGMPRVRIVHTGAFSSVRIHTLAPGEAKRKWWHGK